MGLHIIKNIKENVLLRATLALTVLVALGAVALIVINNNQDETGMSIDARKALIDSSIERDARLQNEDIDIIKAENAIRVVGRRNTACVNLENRKKGIISRYCYRYQDNRWRLFSEYIGPN